MAIGMGIGLDSHIRRIDEMRQQRQQSPPIDNNKGPYRQAGGSAGLMDRNRGGLGGLMGRIGDRAREYRDTPITFGDDGFTTVDSELARKNPKEALQQVLRGEFDRVKDRFLPMEDFLRRSMGSDIRELTADAAGQDVGESFARDKEIAGRDLRRRGQTLSTREQGALDRRRNLAEGLGRATGENLTRRSVRDRNTQLHAELGNRGHQVGQQAIAELAGLAGNQSARDQANKDRSRAFGNMIGSGLGAIAGSFVGMPQVGAALGGAIGGNR